jgi:hypothetical protein
MCCFHYLSPENSLGMIKNKVIILALKDIDDQHFATFIVYNSPLP